MKNIIKMAVTLAVVGCLSGLLLTGLNLWTYPIMEANARQQHLDLLQQFFPEADDTIQEVAGDIIFDVVFDSKNEFLGVMALAQTSGYGGTISYYLGIGQDGLIEGVYVVGHSETPGIGCIITEPDFQEQLVGIDVSSPFVVGECVDTVTGATVTTEAFLRSVSEVIEVSAGDYFNSGPADDYSLIEE